MQMEREIRNRSQNQNVNGVAIYTPELFGDISAAESNGRYPTSSSADSFSSSSSSSVTAGIPISPPPAVGYIEHVVSKLDTLAGVAIKYGVEVSDIKKMNGLVTDLQMFALKSIQIPLPGRHPPSPCLANGSSTPGPSNSDQSSVHRIHRDLFGSFQSLRVKSPQHQVSPAMSSLQGYYGLKPTSRNSSSESIEMAIYRKAAPNYLEDGPYPGISEPILNTHRKSKSLVNGFSDEETSEPRDVETDKKLIRRRQKSEADFSRTPEMLLEDNSSNSGGGFSAITSKHLALRSKAAGRTVTANDVEINGLLNPIPVGMGDSFIADGFSGVRKSSSTPSLQEPENGSSMISSTWSASKWSLKPDIGIPIFDGLPKPISGRKSKAALD